MLKKCTVKIYEVRRDEDSDDAEIEITVNGTLRGEPGNYVLRFDEVFADDIKSKTVITVTNGKCVNIVRRGDITTGITVELGQRHVSHYVTPYGEMLMGTYARAVEDNITENGGTLRIAYVIDFFANVDSEKEMIIEVTPKG